MISPSLPQGFPSVQSVSDALYVSTNARILNGFLLRSILALLSAGLLTCSLPNPDMGWLAWIALAPLLIACDGLSPVRAASLGFTSGIAANVMIYHWVFEVQGFGIHHFLILSTFFSLFPAVWCAGLSLLHRRRSPLILAAPALWVLLDYMRAHAGFMAFPWGTLAQTQHKNIAVLQLATITGEYGITFLVALGNAALAGIVLHKTTRHAVLAGLTIALVHLGGGVALLLDRTGPTIRIAAVQPNILLGERSTVDGRALVLERLSRLTHSAAASNPSLIVWPETAVVGNLQRNPLLAMELFALAQQVRAPILFGAGEVDKLSRRDAHGTLQRRAYNSAYVVTPEQGLGTPYIKRVLMPFGEYVPMEDIIGWPAWLAPPTFQKVAGERAMSYRLSSGMVFSPLICWENLFAELARESVREGSHLLVVLTNDVWFGRTAEPRQHNLASVLRAVENRVPIVMASNTGPSEIIDSYGRIVAQASRPFSEEIVTGDVKLAPAGTIYTRFGDVFAFIIIGSLALFTLRYRVSHGSPFGNDADQRNGKNSHLQGGAS